MAALDRAQALGIAAVETDAMLTADSVLVLSHDEELGRAVLGSGKVSEMTAESLRKLDAGILGPKNGAAVHMALLSEAMDFCQAHGILMNIEIKPAQGKDAETGQAVARAVLRAYENFSGVPPLLSSFSVEALRNAARIAPIFPRALLLEQKPLQWQKLARELGVIAIHPDAAMATPEFVQEVRSAGYQIMVYTVDDVAAGRELLSLGVDAICTNRPDLFL